MKKRKNSFSKIIRVVFLIIIIALLAGTGFYFVFPEVSKMKKENPKKTSFMEYREKEWKNKGKKLKIQKKWVPLSNISPYVIKAVIIAEDDKFWSHHGFDVDAIQKALEKNIEKGAFKVGGSTISQQLAKNLYLTPAKNPVRKLKEAVLTWRIERTLSKRRILELYLNVAEWGEGIFGVEAASLHYYGKTASDLNPEEAARLAVVLPNPRKLRVDGESRYVEKRAKIIYNIMVKRGIVIPEYEDVMQNIPEEKSINHAPPANGEP
jgi:monofunctional biosynthetic peptidoglycan transglycosylase